MNEADIIKRLGTLINTQIAKSVEPLILQLESFKSIVADYRECSTKDLDKAVTSLYLIIDSNKKELDKTTTLVSDQLKVVSNEQKANTNTIDALINDNEILEQQLSENTTLSGLNQENLDKALTSMVKDNNISIKALVDTNQSKIKGELADFHSNHIRSISDQLELNSLEQHNKINDELLRLNTHVNSKLNSLKGEKGDTGEKGEQGIDGCLSGVSRWENGSITKLNQTVTYKNGLWLCACEQTAQEPGTGDAWSLVIDGIAELELNDHTLSVIKSSGSVEVLGDTGFNYRGEYDAKSTYKKYDLATFDGTTFISLTDDNSNRPPSNTWRALAKRGKPGKQGKQGEITKADIPHDDIVAIATDVAKVVVEEQMNGLS